MIKYRIRKSAANQQMSQKVRVSGSVYSSKQWCSSNYDNFYAHLLFGQFSLFQDRTFLQMHCIEWFFKESDAKSDLLCHAIRPFKQYMYYRYIFNQEKYTCRLIESQLLLHVDYGTLE